MRLRARACGVLVLLACLAGVAGCGENGDQRAASGTVTRFYEALKKHDAGTACGLVSPGVVAAILGALGESGKPCVAALGDAFRTVARSPNPHFFDSVPKVVATTVHGDHATVVIGQSYQRRRLILTRVRNGWKISGSPDFR